MNRTDDFTPAPAKTQEVRMLEWRGGFPDKPTRLSAVMLAAIAGAAGLGGALPIYTPDKGRRLQSAAAEEAEAQVTPNAGDNRHP